MVYNTHTQTHKPLGCITLLVIWFDIWSVWSYLKEKSGCFQHIGLLSTKSVGRRKDSRIGKRTTVEYPFSQCILIIIIIIIITATIKQEPICSDILSQLKEKTWSNNLKKTRTRLRQEELFHLTNIILWPQTTPSAGQRFWSFCWPSTRVMSLKPRNRKIKRRNKRLHAILVIHQRLSLCK